MAKLHLLFCCKAVIGLLHLTLTLEVPNNGNGGTAEKLVLLFLMNFSDAVPIFSKGNTFQEQEEQTVQG